MTNVVGTYYPRNINMYVPLMEYAADVVSEGPTILNLGAPVALDADGILNDTQMVNGSAVTVTTFLDDSLDATYGRNITAVASSTNTRAMAVYGRDYLGQPMIETITLTSATTAVGKKAFKYLDKIVFASASDTTTVDVGWGDTLGLPYKTLDILDEFESDVKVFPRQNRAYVPFVIPETELLAGTSIYVSSPIRGYITRLDTVVQGTVTTGGTITVELANVAVAGLSITIANSDAAGAVQTDAPTSLVGTTNLVAKGGAIEIVPASAFATAGAINGLIEITPATFVAGDSTTPTATTGDTRGTYDPNTVCDGSTTFKVFALLDRTNLHGVAQYYA